MTRAPHHKTRAFTLVELIVVIVVLGILSGIAVMGYKTVIAKSTEAKQVSRMIQVLKEAKVLYVQNIYSDPSYTWAQAIASAVGDLPTYTVGALSNWSEGAQAVGGTNLNTNTNGWTIVTDNTSSDAIYSAAPNDVVMKEVSGVVYVSSSTGVASTKAVFGMVSQTIAPFVWVAGCSGNTCDAAAASSGPPSGGSYASGTTAVTTTTTVSYSVGNTGPGGGTVFYVSATPFACGPTMNLTCTYLEAAPNNWYAVGEDPVRSFSGYTMGNLVTTNNGLGYGYQNTLALVAQSSTADRAITLADGYTNGGMSDWFLPSKVELNELCKYVRQQTTGNTAVACDSTGTLRSGITAAWWWSSSAEAPVVWRQYIGHGGQVNNGDVTAQRSRPIRAG